jgi:hypothetical protein
MQMKQDWKTTDDSAYYYDCETGRVLAKVYKKDDVWMTEGTSRPYDKFVGVDYAMAHVESSFENYEKRYEQALDIDAKTREWERQQVEIMNAKFANTKKTWWERLFER